MNKDFFVYILASKKNGTIYVGITSNITKRIWEHKNNIVLGFTSKYSVHKLVYFETYSSPVTAIAREKYLKGKSRNYKISLIETNNPTWNDLDPSSSLT